MFNFLLGLFVGVIVASISAIIFIKVILYALRHPPEDYEYPHRI